MASPRASDLAPPASHPEGVVPAAIQLDSVTRLFETVPALVRVRLRVQPGEVIVLRGANGAGKTTLLRVIATALSPTYGTGSVFGFDLVGDRLEIRRRSELLGHRTGLYQDLTAAENLRFACSLYGLRADGVLPALERAGLASVGAERVRGFSEGMRQRLALARLFLRQPDLLLLDEPYGGLDRQGKALVDEAIHEASGAGRTVVLATHDPAGAHLGCRAVEMRAGRVVE